MLANKASPLPFVHKTKKECIDKLLNRTIQAGDAPFKKKTLGRIKNMQSDCKEWEKKDATVAS